MKKKPPTAAERRYMGAVAALGCVACRNMGISDSPAEIHHVRFKAGAGQKSSHYDVIPLCWQHHSAQSNNGFHYLPKTWQITHGLEQDLLEQIKNDYFDGFQIIRL